MTMHAGFGSLAKALPSGRRDYEPFPSGITPASGAAPYLTDCLHFVASLDTTCIANGQALNLKYTPWHHRPSPNSPSASRPTSDWAACRCSSISLTAGLLDWPRSTPKSTRISSSGSRDIPLTSKTSIPRCKRRSLPGPSTIWIPGWKSRIWKFPAKPAPLWSPRRARYRRPRCLTS